MLAVIKASGKQYLVKEGDILLLDRIKNKKVGEKIDFENILLLIDEKKNKVEIGKPYIKEAKVEGEILEEVKGEKVLVVKFKPKTRYRRKKGYRPLFSKVKITKIVFSK
jgi:large subunit ribosomal protein L21